MNSEFTRSPVDVTQLHGGGLACPQPQPGQHREDREVAAAGPGIAIAAAQQQARLSGTQPPRQGAELAVGDSGHRRRELPVDPAGHEQKAQQRPQRGHHALGVGNAAQPRLIQHEPGDLSRRQPAQPLLHRTRQPGQEAADSGQVTADRHLRQPTLADQEPAVLLHQPRHAVAGVLDGRLRRGNHADPAQVRQQRPQPPPGPELAVLPAPVRQEPAGDLLGQLLRHQALAVEPAAHMRHQLRQLRRRLRSIALPLHLGTEPGRIRRQRASYHNPQRITNVHSRPPV